MSCRYTLPKDNIRKVCLFPSFSSSFQIISGVKTEEEKDKVTTHAYNSKEGPLWCVRLFPEAKSSPSQVDEDFPNNYSLIFGIHHSLSDGTTNVKICNLLCHIINDVMGSQNVNDGEQLGEITGDEEIRSLYDEEMTRLRENPELCEEIKRELTEGSRVRPFIRQICAVPGDVPVLTRSVDATFDQQMSGRFYQRAKSKGVSLHSALTGLFNLSLVDLMQEHGISEDRYDIRAGHDINVRRYYKGNSSKVLGIHGPLFGYRTIFVTPKKMLPVFWETVKGFHEKFHSDLSSRKVLTTAAYRIMNENTDQNFYEMFKADAEPNYYYTISNMGNLDGTLFESSSCVSLRKLIRFSSLRNRGAFMCLYIHTFRRQLNITFTYSTRFLTHDFVHRLKELCHFNMKLLCEM